MLLTMFIVAMLVSLAVVTQPGGHHKALLREAQRLKLVLESASEEAVLQGQQLALTLSPDSYRWHRFDRDSGEWLALEGKPFNPHQLAEQQRLKVLEQDDEPLQLAPAPDNQPRLLFLSSGDSTVFLLELLHRSEPATVRLEGDGLSGFEIYEY